MDGGAWGATVHGVAKSRTQLSDFTHSLTHSCFPQFRQSICISSLQFCVGDWCLPPHVLVYSTFISVWTYGQFLLYSKVNQPFNLLVLKLTLHVVKFCECWQVHNVMFALLHYYIEQFHPVSPPCYICSSFPTPPISWQPLIFYFLNSFAFYRM